MRVLIHFYLLYYFPLRFDEKKLCNAEIFAARSIVNFSASFLVKSQGANTKIKLFDVFLWKFETSIKSCVHTYIVKKILKRKENEVKCVDRAKSLWFDEKYSKQKQVAISQNFGPVVWRYARPRGSCFDGFSTRQHVKCHFH